MTSSPHAPAIPKRRWYTPTPTKFLWTIVLLQGVLLLSDHYQWFWFNKRQGYTVLIAVAATASLLLLLLLYSLILRMFGAKSQFSLATLLVSVVVMAAPLGWLGREIDLARQQRAAVAKLRDRGGSASYAHATSAEVAAQIQYAMAMQRRSGVVKQKSLSESLSGQLESIWGQDFFNPVIDVWMRRPDDESLTNMRGLPLIQSLRMENAMVSDEGMRNLRGLTKLKSLEIMGSEAEPFLGDVGIEHLRGLTRLEDLQLINTDVTDAGLGYIGELKQLKSLTIDCHLVTDAGLLQLAELKELTTLRLLGGKITEDGVQKLREVLPHCRIVMTRYR